MTIKKIKNTTQEEIQCSDHLVDFSDYIHLIIRYKKIIYYSCAIAFFLTCIVCLMLPNIYISTARILPPQDNKNDLSSMLGGVSDLAALAGISVGGGSSADLYIGMLKSRRISDKIIDRFDLMSVYKKEYRTNMYERLNKVVFFSLGKKDGIISISVEDKNPDRAANIANAYIDELKKLNVELNLNSASRERVFLKERLGAVSADLASSENALKEFQEKNKTISIDSQASAIINAIASLKGELASNEVELGVLLSSQTEQNPQVKALREGISQIKEQINRLGDSGNEEGGSDDIFLSTSAVPELELRYARLIRDFKIQESLFEALTKQYELAKIHEEKNTSTIQILDSGNVPDVKSRPQRLLIIIFITVATAIGVILLIFLAEILKNAKNNYSRIVSEKLKKNKL